jgi:hypothetical protein
MHDSSMLSMQEIIQLTIWDRLDLATTNSVGADFLGLLTEVDESIEQLPPNDRLAAAGEAIRRLGEIYADRSAMQLSEIEYLFRPEQEPIMSLSAFDRYVRQSMLVDLEQFIEAPALPEYEREYNLTMVREKSKAEILALIGQSEEVDPAFAYQQAIGLAHNENISAWGAAISARLDELNRAVSLLELQESFAERPHGGIEMSLVQVWLALLLNGMTLEQRGDFYQTEQVWILR